ncbi:MAG: hypothetical protein Q7R31_02305 [Candidatus Levybacteria bacterium]|nr:hypothetical protein [Candidatus Levybacteria bacterium]
MLGEVPFHVLCTAEANRKLERQIQEIILTKLFAEKLRLEQSTYRKNLPLFKKKTNSVDVLQIIVEGRLPLSEIAEKAGILCGYEIGHLDKPEYGHFAGKPPYVVHLRIGNGQLKKGEREATLLDGIGLVIMHPEKIEINSFLVCADSKMGAGYLAAIRRVETGTEVFYASKQDIGSPKFQRLIRVK